MAQRSEDILNFSRPVEIDGNSLTIDAVAEVARAGRKVVISPAAIKKMADSRAMVEKLIKEGRVAYGVTTGFGKFSTVNIEKKDSEALQENLIMSHAIGVGDPLDEEVIRGIMLLRANALSKGFSGIRPEVVEILVRMLNQGVHPVIPEQGSLGASGDLVPLAHMVLVMIGKGEAVFRGKIYSGRKAMELAGIPLVRLVAKEGLALINGTQVMTAIGTLAYADAFSLARTADVAAAMTMEALEGLPVAFDPRAHQVRPHPGQLSVAANMCRLLAGSQMISEAKHGRSQDAYALRCIPQVHGASRDALDYVKNVLEIEINSVTDNPIIFVDDDEVISGGNFHGQPVALAMDFLSIAVAELASISERRIERLVNPALNGDLPAFLTSNGGLNSGYMIAQYVAASLVSENKILAHPACVDSIPSSANQEDHVSMGTIGARKARKIVENVSSVIAIEMICAAQAMDLRGGKPGPAADAARSVVRNHIPFLDGDRELRFDIQKAQALVKSQECLREVGKAIGGIA